MKKIIIGVMMGITILITGCAKNDELAKKELKMNSIDADYGFDRTSYEQLVSNADYTFIGEVVEDKGTVYINNTVYYDDEWNEIETPKNAPSEDATPYTHYKVRLIKNIKGELVDTELIDVYKYGGLNQDGKSISIIEEDQFLNVNNYYGFNANAGMEGELYSSGQNSSILLENVKDDTNINQNEKVVQLENATEHPGKTLMETKYISKFDVNAE